MHPFALTRYQLVLIAVAVIFFVAGGAVISQGSDVIGIGLWQVGILASVGIIAAGNVRWIIANMLAESSQQRDALYQQLQLDMQRLHEMADPSSPDGPRQLRGIG